MASNMATLPRAPHVGGTPHSKAEAIADLKATVVAPAKQSRNERWYILFQNYVAWGLIGAGVLTTAGFVVGAWIASSLTQYASLLTGPLLWSKPWKMLTSSEEYEELRGHYVKEGSIEWMKEQEMIKKVKELDEWLRTQRAMGKKKTGI